MLTFLEDPDLRLIFFGGKGGVGKTTCAAATALHHALHSPQNSVLLVSTDPAHSLVDSLGSFHLPDNLTAIEFNAQQALKSFQAQHRDKFVEIAARGSFFDEEDIRQVLELSLPGLDELMALLEIAGWVETQSYTRIIVDTAPTGHTLRLLTIPGLIRNWLKALDALMEKHRFMQQRFRGAYQPDEMDRFLASLTDKVKQVESLLRHTRLCRFVPVMLAEEIVISETLKLLGELRRRQIPVVEIIVNRLYPESSCPRCAAGYQRQRQLLAELASLSSTSDYVWWGLPLFPEEIRGANLATLWKRATALELTPSGPATIQMASPPFVENPYPCPTTAPTFLILAGKGGVGKSTVASATALRLAREFPERRCLLFSTDPAHSLSACLKLPVGPRPVHLAPGLTAIEIDAPGEFAAFKKRYRQDLERFFQSTLKNIDVPFDRQVLERLLDLSPPGLDEIMALVIVLDFLDQGSFDLFILDAAPTGHLLRLLELPELIDEWLKTFFGILLKYQLAFRFPSLSQEMVKISRKVKLLRKLWQDPVKTALYTVSILTEMAFQETSDLLAACDRQGLWTPVLFLNQATPASDCPLCAALNRREALIRAKYQESFAKLHQTVIYRQTTPRGLDLLDELGKALYLPRTREDCNGAAHDLSALSS